MIRIVGLSATLPNYKDVSLFLGVNIQTGLFHFGPEYRPVPLAMNFAGVMERNIVKRNMITNSIAYGKVCDSVSRGHQCMIFVHSRKDTGKTAEQLIEAATLRGATCYRRSFLNHKACVEKAEDRELFA
jgi:activating signal cointegrator complex subunit 3